MYTKHNNIWDIYSNENEKKVFKVDDLPFWSNISINSRTKVLDIGCGTGATLRSLIGYTTLLYGIDSSTKMITKASKDLPFLAKADMRSLPYQKNSFDLVISQNVINYCSVWQNPINEIGSVLKKDGHCILVYANIWSILCPLRYIYTLAGRYRFGRTYHYTYSKVKLLAEEANLSILSYEIINTTPLFSSANKNSTLLYCLLLKADYFLNKIIPWWGTYCAILIKK